MNHSPEKFDKGNIGWLFTKAYYDDIDFDYILPSNVNAASIKKDNEKKFKLRSKALVEKKWPFFKSTADLLEANSQLLPNSIGNSFPLTVDNPGLVYGTGITHESGNEGEFKIGFLFDYTTGLVVIPGHSIKGKLKSFFPELNDNPKKKDKYEKEKSCYIFSILENVKFEDVHWSEEIRDKVDNLKQNMFEGISLEWLKLSEEDRKKNENLKMKFLSVYERDIFNDAVLIGSDHSNNLFLGNDSITPHDKNPLKNPTPLPFIKLLPKTKLLFNFDFKDIGSIIPAKEKRRIVKLLLQEHGIGAKTNVGYGQFQ